MAGAVLLGCVRAAWRVEIIKVVRHRVAVAGRRILSALRDWVIPALVFVSRYSAQHLKERVNVVEAVISSETDANHSWFSGVVSGQWITAPLRFLGFGFPQQARDIRLRAKTATAHSDPPFIAEDGRDQRVIRRAEVEGDDSDSFLCPPRVRLAVDRDFRQ